MLLFPVLHEYNGLFIHRFLSAKSTMPKTRDLPKLAPREHSGIVIDHSTGQPIAGTKVTIYRSCKKELIRTTTHATNERGEYSFEVNEDDLEYPSLYLKFDVVHQDYAPRLARGYSYSMAMTNEALGQSLFFSKFHLRPADTICGRVVDENKNPLPEVEVSGSWVSENGTHRGGYDKSLTNQDGCFLLNLQKGRKAFVWVNSPNHLVEQLFLDEESRKDLGEIRLREGIDVELSVVDANGEPLSKVKVKCVNVAAQEECEPYRIGTSAWRNEYSDDHGKCHLRGLARGEHRLYFKFSAKDEKPSAYLTDQDIQVSPDDGQQFTIEATPHVLISGQSVDSDGNPRNGHLPSFFGKTADGQGLRTQTTRGDKKGSFYALLPVTAANVQVSLTTDEHTGFLLEYGDRKTAAYSHYTEMEGVDGSKDFDGVKVTWFDMTLLLLEIVDSNGEPVAADCIGNYPNNIGCLRFNYQKANGLHRSDSIVPGLELTLRIKFPDQNGGEDQLVEKNVVLTEGETRKLRVVV